MKENHPILRLKNRTFRILTIGSLFADTGNCENLRSALAALIEKTKPDFVFLNGDITRALPTEQQLREILDVLLAPIIERNLPWAHVFGDMDRVNGLPNEDAMVVYCSYTGCLSEPGPANVDGCGNYILPIYGGADRPVMCLYCFDSHSGVHDYQNDYGSPTRARLSNPLYGKHYLDGVRFNQSIYYWKNSIALEREYGEKIPSMFLFHIPIPEMTYVTMNQSRTHMEGYQNEWVRCQVVAGGIFTAAVERGDVRAIFAGHSEHNDFHGIYGRIRLGQMRDFTARDGSANGGTLFEINEEGNVSVSHVIS